MTKLRAQGVHESRLSIRIHGYRPDPAHLRPNPREILTGTSGKLMEYEQFVREVEARLGVPKDEAEKVANAVLRELHDRLTPKEADDLGAQLPGHLKQIWYGFDRPGREVERTHKKDFVRYVAEKTDLPEDRASRAVKVVFKALQLALKAPTGQEGEAWDVLSQLPKDLKRVWLEAAAMPAPKAAKAS